MIISDGFIKSSILRTCLSLGHNRLELIQEVIHSLQNVLRQHLVSIGLLRIPQHIPQVNSSQSD
jgi:hypothetical protein